MASGRVILAWENRIYKQLLNSTNSFLVPEGDVGRAEQALRSMANEPAEALARASNARKTAETFSFDAHVDQFLATISHSLPDCTSR